MSELILPKQYTDKSGKYPQHEGKQKLSYSQYGSFTSELYRPDYIKQYFAGIKVGGNHFTDFGTDLGTYMEWVGLGRPQGEEPKTIYLSDKDKNWLDTLEYPENCIYEDLIVVDCGEFVIEGYIDRCWYLPENRVRIRDFKTGNIKTKASEYASPDYNQTTLYCYQKEQEGYTIDDSDVMLFGRGGNNSQKSPLKLTQEYMKISTPYSTDRALKFLDKVTVVAKEISEQYKRYLDLFE